MRTALTSTFILAGAVGFACGSMATRTPKQLMETRGQVFTRIFTALGVPLFFPMLLLIPAELTILKSVGGIENNVGRVYIDCLVPKLLGVVVVATAMLTGITRGLVANTIGAELIYSLTHFLISYAVLRRVSANAAKTAALTSTVIPWLYSAGIPATFVLMAFLER